MVVIAGMSCFSPFLKAAASPMVKKRKFSLRFGKPSLCTASQSLYDALARPNHIAYRVCGEQAGGSGNSADVATTLNKVDCMDIICVHDSSTTQSTHELRENVRGDLAPREVPPERRHCDRDGRVNVAGRDPGGDPRAQRETDRKAEVDR